jgi:hypothetical protein
MTEVEVAAAANGATNHSKRELLALHSSAERTRSTKP